MNRFWIPFLDWITPDERTQVNTCQNYQELVTQPEAKVCQTVRLNNQEVAVSQKKRLRPDYGTYRSERTCNIKGQICTGIALRFAPEFDADGGDPDFPRRNFLLVETRISRGKSQTFQS